jgi:dienelactone hydrolase
MRFYLNFPLIAGYVLMATTACLGMLQLAGARGGYRGLSLFTGDRKKGVRIGAGLTVGALLAYVAFAPEILTPGPAGTEVAEMFGLCALFTLGVTLVGADLRLRREQARDVGAGETISLGGLPTTLYRPSASPSPDDQGSTASGPAPAVVLLPDPAGFVPSPAALVQALCRAGIAVLAMDAQGLAASDDPLSRRTLLGHLSTALVQLVQQPGIDKRRIGLVGLGLGGDAVLRAAAGDRNIRATLAVSPVGTGSSDTDLTRPGLHWLRELSYLQTWRWRRRWPELQSAAADLRAIMPQGTDAPAPIAVLRANGGPATVPGNVDAERLEVQGHQYFTLLEEDQARQLLVTWLREKLTHDG